MANKNLGAARKAKQDEFYTQWDDIEREMNAYLEYDPDVFRGKTVLLPCDDPEWSNFAKYFALNFTEYGLKKLIATSYAPASNPAIDEYKPTLFELESPQYDETKSRERGRLFVLDGTDVNHDGKVNIDDLRWTYLEGDGDFRSDEVTALRDEADIVVTNPPFSLFRPFVAWLVEGGVKFSIIGSKNATTYADIFPMIQQNKMWIGRGFARGDAYFRIPESARSEYAAGVFDAKTNLVHFRNVSWFTNIEHGRRHEPMTLMTAADNQKFSKHKQVREDGYKVYTNYEAIEVPFLDAIPSDYEGDMGVPITFLDRYNPEQFKIVGSSRTLGHPIKNYAAPGTYQQGGPRFYVPNSDGTHRRLYDRIVIRHRNPPAPGA